MTKPIPTWLDRSAGISWRFLVIVAAAAVVVLGVTRLSVVAMPMLLALFLAAAIQPLYSRLVRRLKPAAAAILCVVAYFIALGGLLALAVGAIVGPWDALSGQITNGIDILQRRLQDQFGSDIGDISARIRSALGGSVSFLLNGVAGALSVAVSLASAFMLSMLVLFFYLKDGELIWNAALALTGDNRSLCDRVGREAWQTMKSFVHGTALVALVDAFGIALGALALGVPSVAAIGLLTYVLAFIPFFGAIFAGAIAVFLAIASGGLSTGIAMAAVVLVVQQLESNLLQPVLVGRLVKLHPLVVALGVIAGGAVAGVLGMFFAIPVIASVKAGFIEVKKVRAESAAQVDGHSPADESSESSQSSQPDAMVQLESQPEIVVQPAL